MVDDQDRIAGHANKHACHRFEASTPKGLLHRAFRFSCVGHNHGRSEATCMIKHRMHAAHAWVALYECGGGERTRSGMRTNPNAAFPMLPEYTMCLCAAFSCLMTAGGCCCSNAQVTRSPSPRCGPTHAAAIRWWGKAQTRWAGHKLGCQEKDRWQVTDACTSACTHIHV